jgi:hypothetical protein
LEKKRKSIRNKQRKKHKNKKPKLQKKWRTKKEVAPAVMAATRNSLRRIIKSSDRGLINSVI